MYIMTGRPMFYYYITSFIQKCDFEITFDNEEPPYLDLKFDSSLAIDLVFLQRQG